VGAFLSLFFVYFKERVGHYDRLGILPLFDLFAAWIFISLRMVLSIRLNYAYLKIVLGYDYYSCSNVCFCVSF